jgi:hypothetical protein
MTGEPHPAAKLTHDWVKDCLVRWQNEAVEYLNAHPDEPGVMVVPTIIFPTGPEELEGVWYGRPGAEPVQCPWCEDSFSPPGLAKHLELWHLT